MSTGRRTLQVIVEKHCVPHLPVPPANGRAIRLPNRLGHRILVRKEAVISPRLIVGRIAEAFANRIVPKHRARTAGTGSAKKIQAWAPLPDLERSIPAATPDFSAAFL